MEEYMGYEKYRTALLEALKEKFGGSSVVVKSVRKNNDVEREAFCICREPQNEKEMIPIYPEECYRDYMVQGITLNQSVERIVEIQERMERENLFSGMRDKLLDWESVKSNIYPMLLSTEMNRDNLKGIVRRKWMDLSIVYIVRWNVGEDGCCKVKITEQMLNAYGVSKKELHEHALLNMKMDGYGTWYVEDILQDIIDRQKKAQNNMEPVLGYQPMEKSKKLEMFVLTNSLRMFGAAGILDIEFLKEKLGEKDYYILPSSLHETIIVPAMEEGEMMWKELNKMIKEINEFEVPEEERLSDHCYYYEGRTGKLRSCV